MDWHTEVEEEEEEVSQEVQKEVKPEDIPVEVEKEASDDQEVDFDKYKTWQDIPEKERKNYGI